jgi:hypothetical protein
LRLDEPEAPRDRRYVTNDCTYEALREILAGNPNGLLAFRDELVSLLKTLDREEHAAARGFFLSAWNGTGGYTFDRIIRGHTHIEAACVSLLGSTQPGRLAEYVRRAVSGGAGDDGLIQRFGLLVWPDGSPEWSNVDRYPDSAARQAAWTTFERLDKLTADEIGAQRDQFEVIPFLRFDHEAQVIFDEWRTKFGKKLGGHNAQSDRTAADCRADAADPGRTRGALREPGSRRPERTQGGDCGGRSMVFNTGHQAAPAARQAVSAKQESVR